MKEDHTSLCSVVSNPPIPPSLNMKQEPESKKRKMNGVRTFEYYCIETRIIDSQRKAKVASHLGKKMFYKQI